MRHRSHFATSAFLALTALALPAAADPAAIARAELSARLFAEGMQAGDPVLVMAAAKLRRDLALDRADLAPATADPDPAAEADLTGWEAMLSEAAALAAGDPALLGLIEDIRAESTKGVVSGQVYSNSTVRSGGSNVYPPLPFEGGAFAQVYVEGSGAADLNLTIRDAQGRLVCSDTDLSHIAHCGWRPAATGDFTITVESRGPAGSGYALMTN